MAASTAIPKPTLEFGPLFAALTDHPPYPWQQRLFDLFLAGETPADVGLPTGSGKTSIMAVWLIAVAARAPIPRRLVWVVDRRVVVDQATSEAEHLAMQVGNATNLPVVRSLRDALASLSLTGSEEGALAISTLRGEREDNHAWSKDPSRPAIVVGTVDMVGSRLLFSGYGDGRSRRASHAGLLAKDVLLVNDEAHLTPAFASLIGKVAALQKETAMGKRFRYMRLSATPQSGRVCWPESLEEDKKQPPFRKIFEAPKHLEIVPAGKKHSKLLELATAPGPARTLIFVRKPEDVREVVDALARRLDDAQRSRVITLTGTMRGFERDQLTLHSAFQKFAADKPPEESCWLVATSAAEVGVNISSDRVITDVDTADHLIQRFGRLNRFGETEGRAYLLVSDAELKAAPQKSEKREEARKRAALAYFRQLLEPSDDISTARLFASPPPESACEERPLEAPLQNWHVDVWSETSLGSHPARPQVEPWLHGKQDECPETYIAWREDVCEIAEAADAEDLELLFTKKYPVFAHERLREPTFQLQKKFVQLAGNCDPKTPVLCVKPDGSVNISSVRLIADAPANKLAYCHMLLPPGCGSLQHGMFSVECPKPEDVAEARDDYDLAGCELDEAAGKPRYSAKRACYRTTSTDDGWRLQRLGGVPTERRETLPPLPDLNTATVRTFATSRGWRLVFRLGLEPSESGDNGDERKPGALLYFKQVADPRATTGEVLLGDHSNAVAQKAAALASKLALSDEVARALVLAGQFHDLGKQEPIWQRAARNRDGAPPVAKPALPMRPRALAGFRHELASLRYAEERLKDEAAPAAIRDLVLHLIAAHHGHARPCFERKAYDRAHGKDSEQLALESARRFARLQRQFGAWGSAYLEAVFKAADALASADAEEYA